MTDLCSIARNNSLELLRCTIVNIEMCHLLQNYKLANASEVEVLTSYVDRRLYRQAASYLYRTVVPKFAGVKECEQLFIKALSEGGCNERAMLILLYCAGEKDVPEPEQMQKLVLGLPHYDHDFTGRNDELFMLHSWYFKCQSGKKRPMLVTGLGGIGKSSLVRKFVQIVEENEPDTNILWLESGINEVDGSISSIIRVVNAHREYFPTTRDSKDLEKLVFSISQNRTTLLVVDNLEILREELYFIFSPNPTLSVIVTSRDKLILGGNVSSLNVSDLTDSDAPELFQKLMSIQLCEEKVPQICRALQNFPLSLCEVANYMGMKNIVIKSVPPKYDVDSFLQEFQCLQKQRQIFSDFLPNAKKACTVSTFLIWDRTVQDIHNLQQEGSSIALELLKTLSLRTFQEIKEEDFPDIQIIGSVSKHGVSEFWRPGNSDKNYLKTAVKKGLFILARFSLLEYQDKLNSYQVHKILQMVTRLKIMDNSRLLDRFISYIQAFANMFIWNVPSCRCASCGGKECVA